MDTESDRPDEEPRLSPPPAGPATAVPPRPPWWRRAAHRVIRPIPGAQPRRRFDLPPDVEGIQHHYFDADGNEVSSDDLTYGTPGPIGSGRSPLYWGFLGMVGVGIALGVYFVVTSNTQLLLWIAAALFIALGLEPIVRWLEAHRVPRPLGILGVLLVLVGGIAIFIATLIPTIVSQTTQLVQAAPGFVQTFLNSDLFHQVDNQLNVRSWAEGEAQKFFSNSSAVGSVAGGVLGVGTAIVNSLFGTLIVLVLTLYFLASMPAMKRWAYRLAPRSRRARVETLGEAITNGVGNYVIGQAVVALLNAVFAFIVMTIVGVPFSALLAFLVALLAFIPLVGGLIAGVLVSLIALTAGWQTAVAFAICYFAYLQFEAYFVSPRIMQRAVAVPGAVAVIAVIAGGSLLGVLGALMAIPTAAAVLLLVREVFIARQDRL
ncbi:AI-2E family transporter [Tersicoccus sp. Bi-70]|uniref:AI-2E family transporter n=1 Tax=Tersicoccus sp. Bi-70 TaxID=1897634 RepID=UPI000975BF25|nr:AI-2E family transporter [Tersicoccus sp. Bi-70]